MRTYHNKQGFSLLELMVAMVAAAILVVVVTVVFTMPYRVMRTNNEYADLRRDMAYAVRMMSNDIRKSSPIYDEVSISTGEDILELPPNALRPDTVKYERNAADGVLTHYINNNAQGSVILNGLRRFHSETATNSEGVVSGVILRLELENDDGDIAMEHETFIHTRN